VSEHAAPVVSLNGVKFAEQVFVYCSGAQTFWLVGHICLSETLRGPQELIISIKIF